MPNKFSSKGYDTADDAAAALQELIHQQPRTNRLEYGGLVYQGTDGKYYTTGLKRADPNNSEEVHFNDLIQEVPGGFKNIKGIVHQHPDQSNASKYFSKGDEWQAKSSDIPVYMFLSGNPNVASHQMGVITPSSSQMTVKPSEFHSPSKLGQGTPVLAKFPLDIYEKLLARKLLNRSPTDPRGLYMDEIVPTRGVRNILAQE